MIRSFELKDIPTIHRYREHGLFLDSLPTLTWGRTLVSAGAVLSPISAAMGVFTSINIADHHRDGLHRDGQHLDAANPNNAIIAQVVHVAGSPFARFTYIAPDSAIESPLLSPLVDHLIGRVGVRGAENLIAEVDEKTHTYEALRRANFGIYSRQRIWKIDALPLIPDDKSPWRAVTIHNEFHVRRLYESIVPGLVQQVEPAPWGRLKGYVYFKEGELLAFASLTQGPRGIWLQPFVHPEMENIDWHFLHLLNHLQPKPSRPVYVCLRSYQSWLSVGVEELGGQPGPSQAVMVRRLTAVVKKPELAPLPRIDNGVEPTTSFFQAAANEQERRLLH